MVIRYQQRLRQSNNRFGQIAQTHTQTTYLAARALRGQVSDGVLVLLQDLGQGDITAFTGNIKY